MVQHRLAEIPIQSVAEVMDVLSVLRVKDAPPRAISQVARPEEALFLDILFLDATVLEDFVPTLVISFREIDGLTENNLEEVKRRSLMDVISLKKFAVRNAMGRA